MLLNLLALIRPGMFMRKKGLKICLSEKSDYFWQEQTPSQAPAGQS
jgi:hypothetical protein